jgi:hypothetical protein
MTRFKMVFNNSGSVPPQFNSLGGGLASIGTRPSVPAPAPRNLPLNAPMIDRVHKAKPGCSACGKKIA